MITALDSNVLLDIFGADATFGAASCEAVRRCSREGRLIACDVVWAEVSGCFPSPDAARATMVELGVEFSALDAGAALAAGSAWKVYRTRGGTRMRMIPDFLIGAHAVAHAHRLLTRDRGFYRAYFRHLTVLNPADTQKKGKANR
ncbi:MAG: type II toxin-antitoxin system VapC family toxin [Candidatus Binatia bacterium]